LDICRFAIRVLSILAVYRSELYSTEKRYIIPFLISTAGLFLLSGLSRLPDFLIGYVERFQTMIGIGEYTKLFAEIIIGLGLMFEMPILVFAAPMMARYAISIRVAWLAGARREC
jgi:Sec-independent protein secretion pathway component TatC